jgi:hypothetical protein
MWDAVRSRQHRIEKIYHFGPNATELRIFGTVAYELKDRRKGIEGHDGKGIGCLENEILSSIFGKSNRCLARVLLLD